MIVLRTLPTTAGALLVDGVIHRHTAVRGDIAPDLHPLVRRFLHQLPTGQRERYAGWCAEAVLVSDRLYAIERAQGSSLSASHARAALWGARLTVVRVREQGDPLHGTAHPPCRSCAALRTWAGVEHDTAPHANQHPADRLSSVDRARRWALALASYAAPDGRHHEIVPPAVDAFATHGGVSALPESDTGHGEVAPGGYLIDPLHALHTVATLAAFSAALGTKLTPLGVD